MIDAKDIKVQPVQGVLRTYELLVGDEAIGSMTIEKHHTVHVFHYGIQEVETHEEMDVAMFTVAAMHNEWLDAEANAEADRTATVMMDDVIDSFQMPEGDTLEDQVENLSGGDY